MMSKLYSQYCDWVCNNPVEAADYETMFKWGSLLFAGRTESAIIPEFLYATSNLLTLHSDTIILSKNNLLKHGSKIKIWLSVLEYCEVFLEFGVSHLRPSMKWTVICLIQLTKSITRIYLLLKYRDGLIGNPPFPPIDRCAYKNKHPQLSTINGVPMSSKSLSEVISEIPRKIRERNSYKYTSQQKYIAEILYTIKPMVHLSAQLSFGRFSWRPYLLSMTLDAISLILHSNELRCHKASTDEAVVISQRCVKLILYLIRSPFYDKCFKSALIIILNEFFKYIPFSKAVLNPLLLYVMKIQSIYFYLWSS